MKLTMTKIQSAAYDRRGLRWASRLVTIALLSALTSGCHTPADHSANPSLLDAAGSPAPHSPPSASDTRLPLPLLPHMAEHQRANMRDHLAAIQEILAALTTNNFDAVERAASRIGYSEQMGQMCTHMGAGAPGFTELALNFHHTADTIDAAARTRDSAATLKAVSVTLQTCVGCHATYRQQIVDAAAWEKITKQH